MHLYWARFELDPAGRLFRFDTRVYLSDVLRCSASDTPLGAVVAKNPGSAQPGGPIGSLEAIQLANDRLLPTVRSIVLQAHRAAEHPWPAGGYIQVLNLFYLCHHRFQSALRAMGEVDNPCTDPAEAKWFPWVCHLWGQYDSLKAPYLQRFADLQTDTHFYFDQHQGKVMTGLPGPTAFARHTQGMVQQPVIEYLTQLLPLQPQR